MTNFTKINKLLIITALSIVSLISSFSAQATIVRFETNQGNFEVNLYDNNTPVTVANFLQYLNDGDYANSIIHRTVDNFIVQGGGFAYNGSWPVTDVYSNSPITNEPIYSNIRGTIAMAKLGGDPNSASNQWFFNTANNAGNLDLQNGGFTVFGEVIGDGMAVIDQIASIQQYNLGGALAEIPLSNYDGVSEPTESNLVIITAIIITDTTVNSASGLNPPKNLGSIPDEVLESGGGGSMGLFMLVLLVLGHRKKLYSFN